MKKTWTGGREIQSEQKWQIKLRTKPSPEREIERGNGWWSKTLYKYVIKITFVKQSSESKESKEDIIVSVVGWLLYVGVGLCLWTVSFCSLSLSLSFRFPFFAIFFILFLFLTTAFYLYSRLGWHPNLAIRKVCVKIEFLKK